MMDILADGNELLIRLGFFKGAMETPRGDRWRGSASNSAG